MLIIPAIDIRAGQVVRLLQGDFTRETIYDSDPVKIAKIWEAEGAHLLHLVDLDGAREGKGLNAELVKQITQEVSLPVELGGGIRNLETIEELLGQGIARVVLGTKAVETPALIKEACQKYGEKIVVGIDARDGLALVQGWTETSSRKAIDLAREMEAIGVKTIIFTNVKSDGMLTGPDLKSLEEMLRVLNISVIASGGVGSLEDIKNIKKVKGGPPEGVIIGKALYAGRFTLQEALKTVEDD